MESIVFMDMAFNQLAELTTFQSLTLTRSFWGIGVMNLTVHPQAQGAQVIEPGVLLFLASDPQNVMIIEDIPTRTRDKLTATGVQLKGIARRRIIVPPLSLPARLWRYSSGAWTEETDPDTIRQALTNETVYQGFERPQTAEEGLLWLDMTELGAVYDWGNTLGQGEVASCH